MDPSLPNQQPPVDALFTFKHYAPYVIAVIIVVNLLIINMFVFFKATVSKNDTPTSLPQAVPSPTSGPVMDSEVSIASKINQATESVKMQILQSLSGTPHPSSTPTPTSPPTPTPNAQTATTHVYFVPLGTGFGSGTDWTTIPQLGATINASDYKTITSVVFEASVRIPTGNQTVYVRLLNADTSQAIAGSDLTLSGGTPSILTSAPITLSGGGSHLYQVQLSTQLGYMTYIDFARLRITTSN